MGQKVSSLAGAFSWKKAAADSSKRNNAATVTNGSSTSAADATGTTDQRLFENVFGSDAAAGTSQPTVVDCGHEMCRGLSKGAAKNTLSFKGARKLNNWVSRFSCSRSKSKNVTKSSPPAENVVPAEPTATQSQIDVDNDDDSCVGTHYRRTEDLGAHYRSTEVLNTLYRRSEDLGTPYRRTTELGICSAFDDITSLDDIPPVEAIPCDDDDDETSPDALDFNSAFEPFSGFQSSLVLPSFDDDMMDLHMDMTAHSLNSMDEDFEDIAYKERAREILEGIDPPPGFRPGLHQQLLGLNLSKTALDNLTSLFHRAAAINALNPPQDMDDTHRIHTSIDYIHYLVPDLLQITKCTFYWGKMDRYEAEKLLENKPEGTFLLRDSAQEEYLFSVSFRKYGRSLHARIEQWNHLFSFDSRDPGVFSANTVCGLIEHYKDPTCCMFFEPMLTIPLNRNFTFSLLHTCRAAICSQITYDDVNQLKLPKALKSYLKEYHYKQRVRVRYLDSEEN